jgi:hypothetical protein
MAVSKRLRFEILRRDNHTCRYCGGAAPDVKLTVDHVIPETLGGTDLPDNLVAACADCNSGKSATPAGAPLVEQVAQDALRWAAALQVAVDARAAQREVREVYIKAFREEWDQWRWGSKDAPSQFPLPGDWRASVGRFHDLGLPLAEIKDCIEFCHASSCQPDNAYRYFAGCAWRVLRQIQEAAAEIAASTEGTNDGA